MSIEIFQGRVGRVVEGTTSPVEVRTIGANNTKIANFSMAEGQGKDKDPHWRTISVFENDPSFNWVTKEGNVKQGDAAMVTVRHTRNPGTDKEGNPRMYDNYALMNFEYISTGKKKEENETETPAAEPAQKWTDD